MKAIKLFGVIIAALSVTSVALANRSIDESVALKDLESETAILRQVVAIKKSEVAEAGSLLKVAERAKAAGYLESIKITSLDLPAVTASR